MTEPPSIPQTCSIAFKEWAGVCDALGSGRQSLILRKGGVSEGEAGFAPEHRAFWLYPTFVHEAEQGLRTPVPTGLVETPGMVIIESLAVVEWLTRIERIDTLATLGVFHDWTESTLLKRFQYRTPGLWALVVRVYRRREPWPVAITPAQLGCRTWVPLEAAVPAGADELIPVLDDAEALARRTAIQSALADQVDRTG